MHIFDNDNFSIIPESIFFDNNNLPISCKNADISAIDNFFDNIAHPYSWMILFLFFLNFFSFTFWDLFYFSGRSSNQRLLCLHISSKVSQEKDFAIVLNSKQLIFFLVQADLQLIFVVQQYIGDDCIVCLLKRRQTQLNA